MRRLLPVFLALAALVLAAAGCGQSSSSSSSGKDPATVAPRGAVLYGSVVVRPEGSLKSSLEAAGRRVLAGREVGPAVQNALEQAFRSGHLDYTQDVKPWLGKHVAFFFSSFTGTPAAAGIVETTDGKKALAAVEKGAKAGHDTLKKQTYRGTGYSLDLSTTGGSPTAYGVLDGFLVVGTDSGFRAAVDAQKGDALADTDAFKTATGRVTKTGLALFYVDTPRLIDAAAQTNAQAAVVIGQLRALPLLKNLKPAAAAVTVEAHAIRVDLPGKAGNAASADALEKLPADSWLAFAAPKAGDSIRSLVTAISKLSGGDVLKIASRQLRAQTGLDLNKDLLNWIGGVSAYATGTSLLDLNVAIVITSRDPAASRRAVKKLAALVARKVKVPVTKVPGGIALHPKNVPAPVTFAAVEDKVVIAYGKDGVNRALHPSGVLKDSASYKAASQALGGRPSFLVYVPSILQLAQGLGAGQNSTFQKALPYLNAYTAIAFGKAQAGGNTVSRLGIGLK